MVSQHFVLLAGSRHDSFQSQVSRSCFFLVIYRLQFQGCRFVPYTFSETIRHRWYQARSKYWCFTRLWRLDSGPNLQRVSVEIQLLNRSRSFLAYLGQTPQNSFRLPKARGRFLRLPCGVSVYWLVNRDPI